MNKIESSFDILLTKWAHSNQAPTLYALEKFQVKKNAEDRINNKRYNEHPHGCKISLMDMLQTIFNVMKCILI